MELHFSHICLPASGIWSLIAREEVSLRLCPPMWRVTLGRDIERNLSSSKGVTMDNFFISLKGWWKMAISHLKYSSLYWRTIPYKRKMICVYAIFSSFSQHFFGFLDFRLDSIEFFKCMTWQSIFIFYFFFFHSHNLSTPGNDTCYRWPSKSKHLFSCGDYFEKVGLLVWGCSYHFCPKKDRAQKYFFEKWAIFGQCALRHQSRWFSSIRILGFCFAHWKGLAGLKL